MRFVPLSLTLLGWYLSPLHAIETQEVTIENEQFIVRINPEGAELRSLFAKQNSREFLWQGDPAFWSDRAPLMFPVNVRFKGDRYTYLGQSYVIPKMGMAIYRRFKELPSSNASEASFELIANKDTLRQYPFSFRLQVTYRLEKNQLINEFMVDNQCDSVMPFALGAHPGFAFPIIDQAERKDFEYWFSAKLTTDRHEIIGSLIQSKKIPFLKEEATLSFGDSRIPDSGILLMDTAARRIGLARKGKAPYVTIDLEDFPNVNLWSPPGFPFACIEPMIGHHDFEESAEAIEEKKYLIRLNPGQSKTFRYRITLYPDR